MIILCINLQRGSEDVEVVECGDHYLFHGYFVHFKFFETVLELDDGNVVAGSLDAVGHVGDFCEFYCNVRTSCRLKGV